MILKNKWLSLENKTYTIDFIKNIFLGQKIEKIFLTLKEEKEMSYKIVLFNQKQINPSLISQV